MATPERLTQGNVELPALLAQDNPFANAPGWCREILISVHTGRFCFRYDGGPVDPTSNHKYHRIAAFDGPPVSIAIGGGDAARITAIADASAGPLTGYYEYVG